MEEAPPLHEQFREIWDFVHDLCKEESKLILVHATDEDAPLCEMVTGPARFEVWENPGIVSDELPMGKPGRDYNGDEMSNANCCPYCGCFVWVGITVAVGQIINCLKCRGRFRRGL